VLVLVRIEKAIAMDKAEIPVYPLDKTGNPVYNRDRVEFSGVHRWLTRQKC
jgi:hypothetical protein